MTRIGNLNLGGAALGSVPVAMAVGSTKIWPPAPAGVVFMGAGDGSYVNSSSTSWTHNIAGDALVVGVMWRKSGSGTPIRSAQCGGVPMTSLAALGMNAAAPTTSSTGSWMQLFGLLDPPQGAQTISVSSTLASVVKGNSLAYSGVEAFSTPVGGFGTETGTALAQSISSAEHRMVVQMFGTTSGDITGYDRAERFHSFDSLVSTNGALVIGDAPGASTVDFNALRSGGVDYAEIAVDLIAA